MKTTRTVLGFLALAALYGCMHLSDPSVLQSSVGIEAAKRGDLQIPTGSLKDVIYVEKPALCTCAPNTEGTLFVLDADGRSATQVKAHFGRSTGNFVEVQRGLKPDDKVIVSDMSAYVTLPVYGGILAHTVSPPEPPIRSVGNLRVVFGQKAAFLESGPQRPAIGDPMEGHPTFD